MQEKYKSILSQYIAEGGESDLGLAYELGRDALAVGIGILDVIDAHNEALDVALSTAGTQEDRKLVTQRANELLKEALAPLEMTRRGYADTIDLLRAQNDKLTKVMEERTRLLQQREDLMMVVTHDLKTPISAADRCIALMLEGSFGQLGAQQAELLANMKESNRRMFAMVKNLLEVYKYEHEEPVLFHQHINVQKLLESVVLDSQLSAKVSDITISTAIEEGVPDLWADEVAMRHVLANLIDNSIKFTPAGGTIIVAAFTQGESIFIEVRDTGKGIGEEDLSKLFQRSFQAERGRKQRTGTGLGLYLCDQIVKSHGGEITCRSTVGSGTTIQLKFKACSDTDDDHGTNGAQK